MVTMEQAIMSVEEATIHHFLFFSSASAITLLPGQDKPGSSGPIWRGSCLVVSCGVRLSELGLSKIRKPQVIQNDLLAIPSSGRHCDGP